MLRRNAVIRYLILFVLLAANSLAAGVSNASSPSFASCEGLFRSSVSEPPIYQPPTRSAPSLISSLRPAPGSLAARDPAVVTSLVDARSSLIVSDERFLEFQDRDVLRKDLEFVGGKLRSLRVDLNLKVPFADAVFLVETRLRTLRGQIAEDAGRMFIEANLRQIEAQIWEIVIATQFNGAKIFINRRLSELYPRQFQRFGRSERYDIDREIDIAILNEDGSWRWIEVKDWSLESLKNESALGKVVKQSYDQLDASKLLGIPNLELVLVLKYSAMREPDLQGSVFDDYYYSTAFQRLIVLFPGASAEQRIELDVPTRVLATLKERRKGIIP